jgi:hypothetical protein
VVLMVSGPGVENGVLKVSVWKNGIHLLYDLGMEVEVTQK